MEHPNPSIIGRTLSHYQVLEKLGEGGMGVVYKARDTELGRWVALKVLLASTLASEEGRRRFLREARAASALTHPGIVTIYEIGHAQDMDFNVMELVDGPSLKALLAQRRLTVPEAAGYAQQIANALAAAHASGVVHRDVKPGNILITQSGSVKVVDFGLAKILDSSPVSEGDATVTAGMVDADTKAGAILGTVAYMSPEQAEGKPVDERSDVFSLGVVLYEMLAGRRPFQGDSTLSTLTAILRDQPEPLRQNVEGLPLEVERVVTRALQKVSANRCSAADIARELGDWQQTTTGGARISVRQLVRQPKITAALVAGAVVAAALAGWWLHTESRVRWARQEALPNVNRLAAEGKFNAAFDLLTDAEKTLPGDPEVRRLWAEVARDISVDTEPSGAEVYRKDVQDPETAWRYAGRTPLKNIRAPRGYFLWRFSGQGLQSANEVAPSNAEIQVYQLFPKLPDRPDMAFVPKRHIDLGMQGLGNVAVPALPSFWIDRYEVTNRQFKEFMSKGGYQKRELWKYPFPADRRELSWEEAMGVFRDATGRPGPSTWEAGAYPPGKEDFPVTGVSWHEAAAYCESQGKQLPTVHHWYRAADPRLVAYAVARGNFSTAGAARVGSRGEVGPFGTYDMGGNAREWCFNETGDGRSYVLGGSWRDPGYQFNAPWAVPSLDRADTNGFRCIISTGPLPEAVTAPRPRRQQEPRSDPPISDDAFRAFRSLYAYDRTDLKPRVEATDDSHADWKKVKVSFQAAYGGERVLAYLFLPKSQPPPYQVVIYSPGGGAYSAASSANLLEMNKVDFIIRAGRAALYPILIGMYERKVPPSSTALQARDVMIHRVQDLMRSVDYLESRPDIQRGKIGYAGTSSGSSLAPLMLALEERLRVAVLFDGGLGGGRRQIPETDPYYFAPRVKTPVLMLNGKQDFTFPVETSQKPLFHLLGTPEPDKRHLLFDGGHDAASLYRVAVMREALDWLDKYLGPVK